MKQLILTYNELHLSDDVAKTYHSVLESLGIKSIVKDVPNNQIKTLEILWRTLPTYARNRLDEVIYHRWDMTIETFLHNYTMCEVGRKMRVGPETIKEINTALRKLGYNWCAYCRNCPLAEQMYEADLRKRNENL